jgi:hypothetical protein
VCLKTETRRLAGDVEAHSHSISATILAPTSVLSPISNAPLEQTLPVNILSASPSHQTTGVAVSSLSESEAPAYHPPIHVAPPACEAPSSSDYLTEAQRRRVKDDVPVRYSDVEDSPPLPPMDFRTDGMDYLTPNDEYELDSATLVNDVQMQVREDSNGVHSINISQDKKKKKKRSTKSKAVTLLGESYSI